jgi:hypothetical protein
VQSIRIENLHAEGPEKDHYAKMEKIRDSHSKAEKYAYYSDPVIIYGQYWSRTRDFVSTDSSVSLRDSRGLVLQPSYMGAVRKIS